MSKTGLTPGWSLIYDEAPHDEICIGTGEVMSEDGKLLHVTGVGRDAGHNRCLVVYFDAVPTDDQMRAFHERSRTWFIDQSTSGIATAENAVDSAALLRPDVAEVEKACAAELVEFFYPANPPYLSKEAMAEDMTLVIARHFRTAAPDNTALLREAAEAPFGYAYRYHDCIRFNTGGREINGGQPTEVIPLYTVDQLAALLARLEKEAGK